MRKCANNCPNEACRPSGGGRVGKLCRECNAKRRVKQANTKAQPKCACGNCLPMGKSVCGGCSGLRQRHLAQLHRDLRMIQPPDVPVEPAEPPTGVTFNEWFLSLEDGRQALLRVEQWMLADNAFEAGKALSADELTRLNGALQINVDRINDMEARIAELVEERDLALRSAQGVQYRRLRDGELVGEHDEFLHEDAQTWSVNGPKSSWLGAVFNSGFHMPMRRRVPTSAEVGGDS